MGKIITGRKKAGTALCGCGTMLFNVNKPCPNCGRLCGQVYQAEKIGLFFVFCAKEPDTPSEDWWIVPPEDVPVFVKEPATMARLVAGEMAHSDNVNLWFRVETCPE